jgi:hypothetical protein
MPKPATNEALARLDMNVITGIWPLLARARPRGRVVSLQMTPGKHQTDDRAWDDRASTDRARIDGKLESGTLYGVGSLLKRMSRYMRKLRSLKGSSGTVSSAATILFVMLVT